MAVSQKQIAEKLGVSIALVSRVLSGKAAEIGIAPDTIQKVMTAAEEMGYVPSAAALSLKGKATRTLGVAVYDFKDPFFGELIEQIQIQAHEHNYSLILTGFLNRTPDEQDLQPLYKYSLDGLIVIGTDLNATWLKKFQKMPVARIGHSGSGERSIRVTVDENQTARLLLDHIIQRGCTRALYVSADLPAHRIRRRAFDQAADALNIELLFAESTERDAFLACRNITADHRNGADALICATDQVAMGALNALNEAGIHVPDQIVVTGFDGIAAAKQFVPSITTLHQPISEIVREAFHAVIHGTEPRTILLPGKLIVRQSA